MVSVINPKVLLIGLDGATYDLIKLWVKEKKLPTFSKLLKQGAYGKLKTTIPPHSAIAWVSAFTGKNAGKHGVFHFIDLKVRPRVRVKSAQDIKSMPIWGLLSDKGKKVIVVHVPFTYPPSKINGIMIPGPMTPSTWGGATLPKDLKEKFLQINYEIEISGEEYSNLLFKDKSKLLQRLFEITEKRAEMALHLIKNYKWDVFAVVFTMLDKVQHIFWGYMDPNSSLYDAKDEKRNYILRAYQKIDNLLNEILSSVNENVIIVLMSDHGFGLVQKYFLVDAWLSREGLLKPKRRMQIIKTLLLSLIFRERIVKTIFSVLSQKSIIRQGLKLLNVSSGAFASSDIDFTQTRVYCPATYGLLRVNVRGRDPMGTVDPQNEYEQLREHVISSLYDLTDSETGEKVVKRVYRKEELYRGPYAEEGPDLVFETYHKYFPLPLLTYGGFFRNVGEMGNGNHRDNGFIALFGPGIEKGKEIEGSNIMDIAPTISFLQGCTIPSDMDGKVLTKAFSESFIEKHPIRYGIRREVSKEEKLFKYSEEGEKEIKERLKSLGYI